MYFSRNGETDRINAPNQLTPVSGPLDVSFLANAARGFLVEITDCYKLRRAFCRERGMNARVLAAKTAGADDCCT